jgi:Putative Flp pilus-assembly TadE/G-like
MRLVKDNRGQTAVLSVFFLAGLLGMAALVLDVGSWFRASRQTQAAADASALAGAQALPTDPASAQSAALTWAAKNGGGVAGSDITISSDLTTNDTIQVKVKRTSPSFFSKLFGIGSADVGSKAVARTDLISQPRHVAPIVVKNTHPLLSGPGCPCFNQETTIPLSKNGEPGAFDLINLDSSHGGTNASILADWILHGFDDYLSLGDYFSDAGARFDASAMQDALAQRLGTELLFPVYDRIVDPGSNATYHVIGFVGYYLTGFDARGGKNGTISGYFTQVIWDGLQVQRGETPPPDYGARTVQLVN